MAASFPGSVMRKIRFPVSAGSGLRSKSTLNALRKRAGRRLAKTGALVTILISAAVKLWQNKRIP